MISVRRYWNGYVPVDDVAVHGLFFLLFSLLYASISLFLYFFWWVLFLFFVDKSISLNQG